MYQAFAQKWALIEHQLCFGRLVPILGVQRRLGYEASIELRVWEELAAI